MIKKLLLILLSLFAIAFLGLGILVAVASTKADEFQISRSATIAAPAPVVFDQVNTLKKWQAWSPWIKRDPGTKVTYAGPESGTGASYSWVGDKETSEGKLTITDSRPSEKMECTLVFLKPFEATNTASFILVPEDGKTKVTWIMAGKNNIVGKVMCLFMDMDKMVGGDFEEGLSSIKAIAEKEAASAPAATTAPAPESAPAPAPSPAPNS
ncbi:SRPBCC family protein [Roseimicrobium sp. ORNL1]|uniref:SRPBCC family protein n=1 Tax=Roseimicrobium sp. ORNL1 TaxID=2711231 RepID=UPI0013E0EF72|nr:SRPBCC family protein [Roseimicrobium sp. ORNL1]QIF04705.1 SRPBCC family protein [Roseimicrobium sp. ORNL1]